MTFFPSPIDNEPDKVHILLLLAETDDTPIVLDPTPSPHLFLSSPLLRECWTGTQ